MIQHRSIVREILTGDKLAMINMLIFLIEKVNNTGRDEYFSKERNL